MNQEYRGRVKRHLEAGGDPKYVNVKRKAQARRNESLNESAKSEALEKAKGGKKIKGESSEQKDYKRDTMKLKRMGLTREDIPF